MRGLIFLLLVGAAAAQGAPQVYAGHYRYFADAASFQDCRTGDRWPVAMKAANAELERLYLEKQKPGKPLWVKVKGEVKHKLDLTTGTRKRYFVVREILDSGVRECDKVKQAALEGSHWILVSLGTLRPPRGERRTADLTLQPDTGKAAGFSGCNHFMAGYSLDGESLAFGPIGSTRMFCEKGHELEDAYLDALQATARWRVRGDLLELYDGKGKRLARFVQAEEDGSR